MQQIKHFNVFSQVYPLVAEAATTPRSFTDLKESSLCHICSMHLIITDIFISHTEGNQWTGAEKKPSPVFSYYRL